MPNFNLISCLSGECFFFFSIIHHKSVGDNNDGLYKIIYKLISTSLCDKKKTCSLNYEFMAILVALDFSTPVGFARIDPINICHI